MRTVCVARKPCKGSMTSNVLEWHCGAINIDGTRVGSHELEIDDPAFGTGRWPANLLLCHLEGCQHVRTEAVPGYTINVWKDGAKPFGDAAGLEYEGFKAPDQVIPIWDCVPDCPVAALDAQSGYLKTGRVASHSNAGLHGWKSGTDVDYADQEEGGAASKFFCQFQSESQIWAYLTRLITPPDEYDPVVLVEPDFGQELSWEELPDESVHGIILEGDVGSHVEEVHRILRPGAFCLVLSSRKDPIGWRTACHLEDARFEIRDSLFLLDSAGDVVHYVAKATTKEKNIGLPGGLENSHETVKPIRVMERLMSDVPGGSTVVDPFMGSGSTGIACIRQRKSFIGIEREAKSLEIAHHRIAYWNASFQAWDCAEITSEFQPAPRGGPVSLADFFDDD